MRRQLVIFTILFLIYGCSGTLKKQAMEIKELPEFIYNPNALDLEIIKEEKTECPVCRQTRDYVYVGPFYSELEVEGICPWCIKDGAASAKFQGEFQDRASCEPVNKNEYVEELVTRTPGYVGWQQEKWLSHSGDFCALEAYVGWNEIAHLKEGLENDLNKIKSDYNLSQPQLEQYLVNKGTMQGYLFKCIHCGQPRLTIDMN